MYEVPHDKAQIGLAYKTHIYTCSVVTKFSASGLGGPTQTATN